MRRPIVCLASNHTACCMPLCARSPHPNLDCHPLRLSCANSTYSITQVLSRVLTPLDMPSVVVRPSPSQVSPNKPPTMDDHHSERSATTGTEDTTPRRTQPAPPAVRRPNTPRASPPPSDSGSKSSKKKSSSSQAPSPVATRDEERTGGEAKKEPRTDNEKWVESVDYAYEYVPVAQRREGRKNM